MNLGELIQLRGIDRRRSVECMRLFRKKTIAREHARECDTRECASCLPEKFSAGVVAETVDGLSRHA